MDLQYPVGKFDLPAASTADQRAEWIRTIASAPAELMALVRSASEQQLDRPYRPGGWTGLQVIHHMADSHMNAFIRAKLALAEDRPMIKPYNESVWAEMADAKSAPVNVSLRLLDALHEKWTTLLSSLSAEQWTREFLHPEMGPVRLDQQTGLYAWHSRHHIAHVKAALARE